MEKRTEDLAGSEGNGQSSVQYSRSPIRATFNYIFLSVVLIPLLIYVAMSISEIWIPAQGRDFRPNAIWAAVSLFIFSFLLVISRRFTTLFVFALIVPVELLALIGPIAAIWPDDLTRLRTYWWWYYLSLFLGLPWCLGLGAAEFLKPILKKRSFLVFFLLLTTLRSAHAFNPSIHEAITKESMATIQTQLSNGKTITFTTEVIDRVRARNWKTDISAEYWDGFKHFTDEEFEAATTRLVQLKEGIISEITKQDPRPELAHDALGTALHTVQDFYAHSTWIDAGRGFTVMKENGRSVLADPSLSIAVCQANESLLEEPLKAGFITSVYYVGELTLGCGSPPPGKCLHGSTLGVEICDGINKDYPGRRFHETARGTAILATTDFINQILEDSRVVSNDDAKRYLMGRFGTLGFVIDTTGSMGSTIHEVTQQAISIVTSNLGKDTEPKDFLLVPFNDPAVGPVFKTADPNAFISKLNSLSGDGGGDCPEPSLSALLLAVNEASRGSDIIVYSDASAKDASLASSIVYAAQQRDIHISFGLTGSCSPVDPAYREIADSTGGKLIFGNSDQVALLTPFIQNQLQENEISLVQMTGTLSSDEFQISSFFVDPSMKQITIVGDADIFGDIAIRRANGTNVYLGDNDLVATNLSRGIHAIINNPPAGEWLVGIKGTGKYSLSTTSTSSKRLKKVSLVQFVNPVMHSGYAETLASPLPNTVTRMLANHTGFSAVIGMNLINQQGKKIGTAQVSFGDSFVTSDQTIGEIVVPSEPFRVEVVGKDSGGNILKRLNTETFTPTSVSIDIDSTTLPMAVPKETNFSIRGTIKTISAIDALSLAAVNNCQIEITELLSNISVEAGKDREFSFKVRVPANQADGTLCYITLSAQKNNEYLTSTVLEFRVAGQAAQSGQLESPPRPAEAPAIVAPTPTPEPTVVNAATPEPTAVIDAFPQILNGKCSRKKTSPPTLKCKISANDDKGDVSVRIRFAKTEFALKKKKDAYVGSKKINRLKKGKYSIVVVAKDSLGQETMRNLGSFRISR